MALRFRADIRTLLYMMVTTALLLIQWNSQRFHLSLYAASCLMAISITVIAHNHNHLGILEISGS